MIQEKKTAQSSEEILTETELGSITLGKAEQAIPLHDVIRSGRLESGLSYFIYPNKKPLNRAELRLVVRAGSVLEEDSQRGLAHIVEHMAFNGTRRFGAGELVKYFESIGMKFGAHLNAYTSFDETVYSLHIPTEDDSVIERSLEILRDWCSELTFGSDEIERERRVGIEEWRQGRGARSRAADVMIPKLYHGTAYAERLPIGTEDSLKNFSHEDLKRFYREWYRPDLMAVIIAGDVDVEHLEKRVLVHFSDLDQNGANKAREYERIPLHDDPLIEINVDPELSRSTISLLAKKSQREDGSHRAYREQLVEQLARMCLNERLSEISQRPGSPFMGAMCYDQTLNKCSSAESIAAFVVEGRFKECATSLFTELSRFKQFGVTKGELDRSKAKVLANIESDFQKRDTTSSEKLVNELVRHFLNDEPVPGIAYERALIHSLLPQINVKETNKEVQSWFAHQGRVIQIMTCEDEVPSETELLHWLKLAEETELSPLSEEEPLPPLISVLPAKGHITSRERIEALGLEVLTLSNGMELWLKSTDFQADTTFLSINQIGGSSHLNGKDLIPAQTATGIASRSGLGMLDKTQLRRSLAGERVMSKTILANHEHGVIGYGSKSSLETLFKMNYLRVHHPRFDQLSFERDVESRREALRHKLNTPEALFDQIENELWWGKNTRYLSLTLLDLEEMDLARSQSIYRDVLSGLSGAKCYLFGDLEGLNLDPLIERYVDFPTAQPSPLTLEEDTRPREIIRQEVRSGIEPVSRYSMTSIIRGETTLRDRITLNALMHLLNTRLREAMREERGDVYHVGLSQQFNQYPENALIWQLKFSTDPKRVEELSILAMTLILDARNGEFTEAELLPIKLQMSRAEEVKQRENIAWLSRLFDAHKRGEDPMSLITRAQMIAQITPDMITEVARRFLKLDHRLEMTLAPKT